MKRRGAAKVAGRVRLAVVAAMGVALGATAGIRPVLVAVVFALAMTALTSIRRRRGRRR